MSHTPTLPEDASHAEIAAALTNRWPEHRVAPSLGRIAALTELLGDPQRAYPVSTSPVPTARAAPPP